MPYTTKRLQQKVGAYYTQGAIVSSSAKNSPDLKRAGGSPRTGVRMQSSPDPAAKKTGKARQFFVRNGLLAQAHPSYEYRPGQLEMAEAVESALAERRHLMVEAGTGTGKTLAYLVPAILSGKRIVVSTGTKNLQEQLFFKDIPFLQTLFDFPLSVCYMKGRNNYVCRQKVYDAERQPILSGME